VTTPPSSPPPERPQTPLERADSGHDRLEEAKAWNAMSYVISGPVLFGGIGWGLDRWLGTSWLVAVGILGGMAVSMYLVWVRYGTQ
jgi:F0F1-type ATP synthase assembly protein I